LVIATDDMRIFDCAEGFDANVLMTSDSARTGSDRVAEVVKILEQKGERFELAANIQGDMPFINPDVIDKAVTALKAASKEFGMSTVATPITNAEEFQRPASVKVVLGSENRALYFSRSPIPYNRDGKTDGEPLGLKHVGLYVFRPEVLAELSQMK